MQAVRSALVALQGHYKDLQLQRQKKQGEHQLALEVGAVAAQKTSQEIFQLQHKVTRIRDSNGPGHNFRMIALKDTAPCAAVAKGS